MSVPAISLEASADAEIEQWRKAPFSDAYEVSSLGRVHSLERTVRSSRGRTRRVRGRILKATPCSGGYLLVPISSGGVVRRASVHELVLRAFVGDPGPGEEALHGDGDKANNRLSNLRWGTPIENAADRITHGTVARGERHGLSVLTEGSVRFILASSRSQRSLAGELSVSRDAVAHVRRGETWQWLSCEVNPLHAVKREIGISRWRSGLLREDLGL